MATHPLRMAWCRRTDSRRMVGALMGGIGYSGNCGGCLYFAKPFIVGKKKRAITRQRSSDSGTELIADEWRDRMAPKSK